MTTRDIILSGAIINNGRLYLPASDKDFFPQDSFGDRPGRTPGKPVEILAGGKPYATDIRLSSGTRISPRRSFGAYLKSIRAKVGERLRLTRLTERSYRLDQA